MHPGAGRCCPASGRDWWVALSPVAVLWVVKAQSPLEAWTRCLGLRKDGQGTACGHRAVGEASGQGGPEARRG